MPHQCTACGRVFADGSKEMLSGCPDCGGNKFQFKPDGTADNEPDTVPERSSTASAERSSSPSPKQTPNTKSEQTPNTKSEQTPNTKSEQTPDTASAASSPESTGDRVEPSPATTDATARKSNANTRDSETVESERVADVNAEDTAQASARSDVVSPDELDRASQNTPSTEPDGTESTDDRPAINDLRDELNDQFESIRIVSPGQYELNLMELYDRQEYIISLQEDGRYVIEMPDAWGVTDE